MFSACNNAQQGIKDNPLLSEFNTPFNVPPFGKIEAKHYMPAFKEAMKQHIAEIDAIVNNSEEASFENTIVALDNSGILLGSVSNIFFNIKSADTNDELNNIAKEVSPLLSKHGDDISLNVNLFKRVKAVYDKKDELNLNTEQSMLLKKAYRGFVRGGANLDEEKKEKLREINKRLSMATLQFGENQLKETNAFELVIDSEEDLAGLPESVIQGAKEAAEEKDYEGKWLFTLQKPSLIPFITYSDKRELREKLFKGYINRCDNNNENDNKENVKQIVNLHIEKAHLLGYTNYAEFVLEKNMSKYPENVFNLLNKIWDAALPIAKKEAEELQKMIKKDGNEFKLQAWDWWYYSEKLRKEKYDFDEEALRPYFKLENVREGMFKLANKLYGITFEERTDIPVYQKDVKTFEVKEADGTHIGIFYLDNFTRSSKRGGAWMTSFRKQSRQNGEEKTPVILNVTNFSKPTANKPSLLSVEEVTTLFHEFGHGLHGLLSNCTYHSLSGTSVPRDFVELPSQVMENWALEPDVLKTYAFHYKTGEVIPQKLIDKLEKSSHFNQGFTTVEYVSAALLDMNWQILNKKQENLDVNKFETNVLNDIGLIPEIVVRYRSTYFSHIFSGGYAAGYYGYIWAAVLDADAFQAFKETSLFDQETAKSFRDNIISKGGTDEGMTLYKNFRGKEPSIDPLLERKGLK
jgi:peptidyl-dipeptidase Dcp